MGRATAQIFGPTTWGPGEGQKRSNIIKFQLQNQFQRFSNQTLCVFSQMNDITYQMGFSFCHMGHAPGMGLGGYWVGWRRGAGVKKLFFLKFNQIRCVSFFFLPRSLGPWAGAKRSVCLSITLSPPKPLDEIQPNFVCEWLI